MKLYPADKAEQELRYIDSIITELCILTCRRRVKDNDTSKLYDRLLDATNVLYKVKSTYVGILEHSEAEGFMTDDYVDYDTDQEAEPTNEVDFDDESEDDEF
jgi:hypothetical protein